MWSRDISTYAMTWHLYKKLGCLLILQPGRKCRQEVGKTMLAKAM